MNRARVCILLTLVICALAASVLTACGSDDSDSAGTPATTSTEPTDSGSDDDSSGGYSY